jgi:hypothetical protein
MSSIASAKTAVQEELNQAKKGATFYQARIQALEAALAQLENIDGAREKPTRGRKKKVSAAIATPKAPKRKPGRLAKAAKTTRAVKTPKAKSSKATGKSGLPSTGGDFWMSLITEEPQSGPEIVKAAVVQIGHKLSVDDRKKLANRLTPGLNALVAQGKIQDSGTGRERRFFRG